MKNGIQLSGLWKNSLLLILCLFLVEIGHTEHRQYKELVAGEASSAVSVKAPKQTNSIDLASVALGLLLLSPVISSIAIIVFAASSLQTYGIIALVAAIVGVLGWAPLIIQGMNDAAGGGILSGLGLILALAGLWASLLLMGLAWGISGLAISYPLLVILGGAALLIAAIGIIVELLTI